jgi:hypothetical protein
VAANHVFFYHPSELDWHLAATLQHASVRAWVFEDGSGLSRSAWGPKIWHSMERLVIDEPPALDDDLVYRAICEAYWNNVDGRGPD